VARTPVPTIALRGPAFVLAVGALAASLMLGRLAVAQQAAEKASATIEDPDPWRLRATAYGWLMSVGGNVTANRQTVDVNASFIDLLQKSDSLIGFMGYFEADKGPVGFYSDVVFAKLGFTSTMLNYRNPIPALRISTTATTAMTYTMTIIDTGGLYEIHRWPGSEGSSTALDGLLGFRIWNQAVDLNLDVLGNVDFNRVGFLRSFDRSRSFGFATASSGGLTWVDPVVGLRLRHQFTRSQDAMLMGDIGGFGLQSTLTWQAVAAYSYAWQLTGYQLAGVIGFRALGVSYSTGSGNALSGANMVLYGPIIGGSIRF